MLSVIELHFVILGDPGAVSRVDKMSVVKVYCKIETSPWALTLTEQVPEAFELPASDWPQKIFLWPISEDKEPGDSDISLHDVFLIDRHCCVARSTGKVSRGKFDGNFHAVERLRSRATKIEIYLKMRAWRCILYTKIG